MKAIRVQAQSVRLEEMPDPKISEPSEVIVRVLAVGLDGTDREILSGKYGAPPETENFLITGHESLGVVMEAGKESGYQSGDLVTALVRRPCKELSCVNCRNGHADFCETGKYTERGIKGAHGYLSEYYVEDARFLIPVPKRCIAYGMLAEPQSIVEKVWDQAERVQQRLIWEPRTALILGSGPLGLLAAATCRLLGLEVHVWSLSPEDSKQAQLLRSCGAVYKYAGQGNHNAASAGELTLTAYTEQLDLEIDLIMECTGYSPLAFEAMSVLGPNGILALLGVTPGNRKLEISADSLNQSLVLENKCVLGSVNASRKDFETGIYRLEQMEANFPGYLQGIFTERMTLQEVAKLDFDKIQIKAVVDVVPEEEWAKLAYGTSNVAYSFST